MDVPGYHGTVRRKIWGEKPWVKPIFDSLHPTLILTLTLNPSLPQTQSQYHQKAAGAAVWEPCGIVSTFFSIPNILGAVGC